MVTRGGNYSNSSRQRREQESSRHWAYFLLSSQVIRQKSVLTPLDWGRAPNYCKQELQGGKEWLSLDSLDKGWYSYFMWTLPLQPSRSNRKWTSLPTTDNEKAINKTTMFRYWTTGSAGRWSPRLGTQTRRASAFFVRDFLPNSADRGT